MKSLAIAIVTIFLAQGCAMNSIAKEEKQETGKKPNVIIFYVDDLGYADVSSYGAIGVETPNVDKLASNGLKFTDYGAVDVRASSGGIGERTAVVGAAVDPGEREREPDRLRAGRVGRSLAAL